MTCVLVYGMLKLTGSSWTGTVRFVAAPTTVLPGIPGQPEDTPVETGDDATGGQGQASLYATLIKSPDVLEPVLKKLPETVAPDDILTNIKVLAMGPRTYEIQVTDKSPERAEIIANGLADNLVKKNQDLYTQQAKQSVNILQQQVKNARADLAIANRQLQEYRVRHNIMGSQTEDLNAAMARLQKANTDRDDVAGRLSGAQARLAESLSQMQTMPRQISSSRPASESPLIKKLEEQYADAEAKLTELRVRFTDEVIDVQRARATRDEMKRRLDEAIRENANSSLPQPNPELTTLEASISTLRREVSDLTAQYATHLSTIETARASVKNAGVAYGPLGALAGEVAQRTEELTNSRIRLNRSQTALDVAERRNPLMITSRVGRLNPPTDAAGGKTKKVLFLALVCAFMLSTGFVLAQDLVDRRVKTVSDAELLLPLPVSAAIPLPQSALSPAQLARITEIAPQSLSSEAYHFLALRLLNAREQQVRSAMVVSAKAGQGTTQTVTNLGITLAQAGYRVVIVDANFRTPQLHNLFGLSNDFGFTDLLEEPSVSLGHVLQETTIEHLKILRTERKRAEAQLMMALHSTSVDKLHVITSGKPPANPWELFRSQNLKEISARLEEFADFILYDTPSALAFTDALNLAPIADGAFLCMRAYENHSGAEERLLDAFKAANVVSLGVVLTDVPAEKLDSYPNYQHYYPAPAPTGSLTKMPPRPHDAPQLQGSVAATPPPTIIDGRSGESKREGWNDYVAGDDQKEGTA